MKQRRVEWLTYRVDGSADYSHAARLECDDTEFRIEAVGGTVRLHPKADYFSAAEALTAAAPLVSKWEKRASLQHGPGAFQLMYVGCKYEGVPPTPGVDHLSAEGIVTGPPDLGNPMLSEIHKNLPDFPVGLSFSGKAGELLEKFNQAAAGNARWVDAGNYISEALYDLRALGFPYRGKDFKSARDALDISKSKLRDFHKLVGGSGDRKPGGGPPLTAEQEAYVRGICRLIILRMARREAGRDPSGPNEGE
jgi:hypothetical protein